MQGKEFRDEVNKMLLERYDWVLSQNKADQVIRAVFGTIKEILKNDEVLISGFGRFSVTKRKPHKLKTPLTEKHCPGGVADVPAFAYPRLHTSKEWRHEIRHHYEVTDKINEPSFKQQKQDSNSRSKKNES